ncbi:MAG TPA: endonuclease III [Drouetiella sp.]
MKKTSEIKKTSSKATAAKNNPAAVMSKNKPAAAKSSSAVKPKPAAAKTSSAVKPKPAAAKSSAVKTKPNAAKTKSTDQPIIKKAARKAVEHAFDLVEKNIAQQEMNMLCQEYPEADCELDYGSAFQLLTAVIMSAQTTDVTVNKVTPALFEKFPDAKALAEADLDEIKEIIKPTGFFNAKANNIQKCAQALVANFGGVVPKTIEELTTLPGVGRKTANVVLGVIFGVPGWTVDTHVQRLSARLGFTKNTEPEKIEIDLQNLFPNQDWSKLSITLIWHGRRMCFARKPDCHRCPVNQLCPSSLV